MKKSDLDNVMKLSIAAFGDMTNLYQHCYTKFNLPDNMPENMKLTPKEKSGALAEMIQVIEMLYYRNITYKSYKHAYYQRLYLKKLLEDMRQELDKAKEE